MIIRIFHSIIISLWEFSCKWTLYIKTSNFNNIISLKYYVSLLLYFVVNSKVCPPNQKREFCRLNTLFLQLKNVHTGNIYLHLPMITLSNSSHRLLFPIKKELIVILLSPHFKQCEQYENQSFTPTEKKITERSLVKIPQKYGMEYMHTPVCTKILAHSIWWPMSNMD